MKKIFCLISCALAICEAMAQKGLRPKETTILQVATFSPQPIDFSEQVVSRLKVVKGFSIQLAATGLGKPRMMAIDSLGRLYITRRDQGNVLLLQDNDKDGRFDALQTVITRFPGVHGITIHDG